MRTSRDHEVRANFTAADYSRVVRWAGLQDRSVTNFVEHGMRRYLDWLEEQLAASERRESMPASRQDSDQIG